MPVKNQGRTQAPAKLLQIALTKGGTDVAPIIPRKKKKRKNNEQQQDQGLTL